MNTITRVNSPVHELEKIIWKDIASTKKNKWVLLLIGALFISAFGIIYVKDLSRRLMIHAQVMDKQILMARELHEKLVVEQSALTSQSRIHSLSQQRLDMIFPSRIEFESIKEV